MLYGSPRVSLIFPLVFALLSACTSFETSKYSQFGAATKRVDTSATQTFEDMEFSVRNYAVLTAPIEPITENSFQPVYDDKTSYDFGKSIKKMEAALDVLALYAQSLEILAGEKANAGIDSSSEDLIKSIKDLKTVQVNISSNNTDAIATGFDAVGRFFVKRQRITALKKAMSQAQPGIDELVQGMTGDIQNFDLAISVMRTSYLAHTNVARPAYGTWNRYGFDLKVAAQLSDYERIKKSLAVTKAAIQKIPAINRQLLLSLDDDNQNIDSLKEFVQQAKSWDSFYQSLATKQ